MKDLLVAEDQPFILHRSHLHKFGVGVIGKISTIPAPRLITSSELENLMHRKTPTTPKNGSLTTQATGDVNTKSEISDYEKFNVSNPSHLHSHTVEDCDAAAAVESSKISSPDTTELPSGTVSAADASTYDVDHNMHQDQADASRGFSLQFDVIASDGQNLSLLKNTKVSSASSYGSQLDPIKLPEDILASPQPPGVATSEAGAKLVSERKPRRQSAGRESAKKGNQLKQTTSTRRSRKGEKSSALINLPASGHVTPPAEELKSSESIECSNPKPGAGRPFSTPNLPDLNSLTHLFQQSFTAQIFVYGSLISGVPPEEPHMIAAFGQSDGGRTLTLWEGAWHACIFQQSSTAQIFVYGSLISGVPPEEPHMIAAFGQCDGGRTLWEGAWHACLERIHRQKSKANNLGTLMQSSAMIPVSSPLWNVSMIPVSSPLSNVSTPYDGSQSSAMPRSYFLDYRPAISQLHPYQSRSPPIPGLSLLHSGNEVETSAAREAARRRIEAASAASKHAENLDAIVKAAELAAEAVSHGGTQSTSGSQVPRFYNQPSKQVTVKPAVSHVEKVAGSSPSIDKSDTTKSQKSVTEGTTGQPHKDSETNAASSLPQLEKSDITKSQKAVAEGTSGQPQKDSETNTGSSLPQLEKCDTTESQEAAAEGTSGQPQKDSETNAGSSLQQLEKSDITNSQDAVAEGTSGQPNNAGSSLPQLENLKNTIAAPAPVEDCVPPVNSLPEVAKETMVDRSGLLKEEQKQPGKEVFSVPVDKIGGQSSFVSSLSAGHLNSKDIGVQETSKPSTLSMETSNKAVPSNVADESVSRCESNEKGVDSTEIIGSGTHPDNPLKGGEPIAEVVVPEEQVKDSADQNQDSTVSDATGAQQKEPMNDIDDKSSGSISTSDHGDQISNLDDRSNKFNGRDVDQVNNPVTATEESPAVSLSVPEAPSALEVETTGPISPSSSKVKGNASKGRKKIREILKNADARGTTSDLYNAYKRQEEKKDTPSAVENPSVNFPEKEVLLDEKRGPTKFEPDDWEDVADISTSKMETGLKHHSEDDNEGMTKKYSRDFLLKFSDHCTDLPVGFEITPEITEALSVSGVNLVRDSYPSPGRGGDRAVSGPWLDRRLSNLGLDVSWNKGPGTMAPGTMSPGWDPRVEMNFPGRGVNHGVLRTPRGQPPGQYIGGILYGQMQSPGQLGVPMQRNNSDSDRWQRATNFQKGLIPSPHTPVMHKAERKYEVGKITDQEQAKQRQLKGILNKLTPQNFEKLFDQVKQVNIDNADTLSGVIGQIFDKALMEPTFVEMYANFCSRLSVELPDFSENNEKITFKRLLLNKCQEEFERGEREEEEANRTEEEGEVKQTEEEREEKRVKARRRMLGNIRLIGELYKKRMLTERIMHECIKKLLGVNQTPDPDEQNIEALCKLMSTIGEMIDHPKAKEHTDVYFDMMLKLSNNMDYSSRVRFMLKDAIDLRKNKWQQRRKVEGPKKIDEVHREAAQERQAQANRLARGPSSNPSTRRAQMDFGPKGSNVLPSTPQMGGYRGLPQQFRAYGNPDPRLDTFETRQLSVSLRPMNDDTITLGPQGGLARGMSIRGQPSMQGMPLHDMDSRRGVAGPNGYGSMSERAGYGQEDLASRWFSRPIYDSSNIQEHNMNYVNRDMRNAGRGFVQVPPSSPPEHARVTTPLQSGPSDTVMSEEHLHDKSIETIKEFYSARDEKEVALCIRDLNAPSFYPSMISIWVIDSFERKDMDRESLTKLLINLAKSRDGILSQDSLVRGFESVLSTLEDAVNDAPKAAEFLGRIFAKVLLENVIPYTEVWRLIYEGGEEQGRLVEIGLAAEVLGVILEIIKAEKGDPFLNNMRMGSDLRLENFRSPTIKKTLRLDKFI